MSITKYFRIIKIILRRLGIIKSTQDKIIKKLLKTKIPKEYLIKSEKSKNILIHSVRPNFLNNLILELLLAKSLVARGNNVFFLFDDNIIFDCDSDAFFIKNFKERICIPCQKILKKLIKYHKKEEIQIFTYSQFITKEKIEDVTKNVFNFEFKSIEDIKNYKIKGIDVGKYALSSAIRYFRNDIEELSEKSKYYIKKKIRDCLLSLKIAENFQKKIKIDLIGTSHGIYSSYGPFLDFFIDKIKNFFTYSYVYGGFKGKSIVFKLNSKVALNKRDEYWNYFKDKIFTNEEKQKLLTFLERRFNGQIGDTKIYFRILGEVDNSLLLKKFKESKNETFALFPNVIWDASLVGDDTIFNSMKEWVLETIDYFKNDPTKNLIIKVHPSEQTLMISPTTIIDHIKNKFPELENYENIIILPPNTNFRPYDLFKIIDAGIVYNGTLGLEMILNKIPVIIAGNAHYLHKWFTYEINSKKDYFNIFENLKKLKEKVDLYYKKALKYGHIYFLQNEIPFPLRTDKEISNAYSYKELKSNPHIFLRGKNSYLDYTCDVILGKEKYIEDWYYQLQ